MTYIVNDKCIKCKLMDCVEVCPVDCFYEGENMLVINPDECIDCGVCEPECPVDAIISDTEDEKGKWMNINQKFADLWPNITLKKESLIDADKYKNENDKYEKYFSDKPGINPMMGWESSKDTYSEFKLEYSTKELVEAKIIPDLSNESLIRRANSIVEITDSNTTLLIEEIDSIKKQYPNSTFIGHGGDRMISSGLEVMHHVNDLAIMGFTEVVKHLPFMINVMGESLEKIKLIRPDRIILIDYPGFNLRLAKNCRPHGIPISYFIMPQLWAWKENRKKYFHRYIDQSLSIFPFEQEWFEKRDIPTNYVGHPFSEGLIPKTDKKNFYLKHNLKEDDTLLAIIPGSRQQEVDRHLSLYLKCANEIGGTIENLKVIITKADNVSLNVPDDVLIEDEDIYAAMQYAKAAITTSGTASLECAIMDTPEVVCYKLSSMSYLISSLVNKAPYISMVNLIAGRVVVPEFLQYKANQRSICDSLLPLLKETVERKNMLDGMSQVRRSLGIPGVYDRAADAILSKI